MRLILFFVVCFWSTTTWAVTNSDEIQLQVNTLQASLQNDNSRQIKTGEKIVGDVFQRWLGRDWRIIAETEDVIAKLDVDVHGSLEASISQVVNAVNANGFGWSAKLYPDMKLLRILGAK